MKQCSKCKNELPLDEFYDNKKMKYGKDCYCKTCRKDYSTKRKEKDMEKYAIYERDRRRKKGAKPQNITNEGFIYLLFEPTFTKHIKIGRTQDMKARLKALVGQLPFDVPIETLECVKVYNVFACERKLHRMFKEKRQKGEWFELDEKDILFIKDYLEGMAI